MLNGEKIMAAKLKLFRSILVSFFLIFSTTVVATPSYKMTLEEVNIINSSTIEASVYIENVGEEELVITSYQCALSINQSLDLTGLTLSYKEGSSELLNEPNLYVGVDDIDGQPELAFVSYVGNDLITQKTRVGTFILEGNFNIVDISILEIKWDFEGAVSTIITGVNFENITNPANHESVFGLPASVEKMNILTATANSTSASRVIDGLGYSEDPNSRWSQEGMPARLVLDLGEISWISKTRISFYYFAEGRVYEYNVKVSEDNISWMNVLNNVKSKSIEWTEEEFAAVKGRYVMIEVLGSSGYKSNGWASIWEIEIYGSNSTTDVEEEDEIIDRDGTLPREYGISQNYPNPFNPSTNVQVMMKEEGKARIDVYNLLGERVLAVLDDELSAGTHEVNIDASSLPSGVYFYRLVINDSFTQTKKMNLLK